MYLRKTGVSVYIGSCRPYMGYSRRVRGNDKRDIMYKACPSESGTDKFMQRFI
jgi:hypothetical protein